MRLLQPVRPYLHRFVTRARELLAHLRTSPYLLLGVRTVAVAIVVVVLAWIGTNASVVSTALAGTATQAPTSSAIAAAPPLVSTAPTESQPHDCNCNCAASSARDARASPESPVYVNTATIDDLRRLPGVGAKRAEAILALRSKIGRFSRIEDFFRVKGVGRAAVRKWRPVVRFDRPETQTSAPEPTPLQDAGAGTTSARSPSTSGLTTSLRSL